MGAAALDLAWTAAGRLDGFWERNLRPWDIAAGIVILREAGGYVTDADGKERMLDNGSVVTGNETIQRNLLKLAEDACQSVPNRKARPHPSPEGPKHRVEPAGELTG